LANGSLIVVEDFTLNAPNTKEYKNILKNLEVTGKSLLLTADLNKNVYLSSRNLPKSEVMTVKDANTYEIINADVLVISENSVNQLKTSYEQI
jgi:large subunit ribosomal protein L4